MAHRISKQKKEIGSLGVKELFAKTRELEDHLFQLRMQFKTGQLPSSAMMMVARKELARVKTAITAKSLSANQVTAKAVSAKRATAKAASAKRA